MSVAPIKPGGWNPQDPLTSAEINDFQSKLLQLSTDADTNALIVDQAVADINFLGLTNAVTGQRINALESMALRPDLHIDFVEDFLGAIHNAGDSRLDARLPWRAHGSGTVSINAREGNIRHPGVLECAIPGNGVGDVAFYFELMGATATPIAFARIQSAVFVMKIEDHASNVNTSMRLGFVSDNSLFNGGDDAVFIFRQRALSATNWYLQRRNAGVPSAAVLLGSQTAGNYSVVRFAKNDSFGLDVFFGNSLTPVTTITSVQLPVQLCTFGAHMLTSSADAFLFTPSIDLMAFRLGISEGRHGT